MQMIGQMILVILFIMLSPCRAGIAAQLRGEMPVRWRCPMFAYVVMPAALMFSRMSAVHFLQRQRKVTICALVQSASGLNVVLVDPLVMSSLTAHSTASA